MAVLKKIAFTGLLAAVALVAVRFVMIVVRVIRSEFKGKPAGMPPK